MLSILQRLPLLPLNSSGILYPRNKSQELFPVNVEKVFLTFMETRVSASLINYMENFNSKTSAGI